jgi:hypothetical protein
MLGALAAPAGAIQHKWSAPYGDAADQVATAIALDNTGGVVVLGHFDGTVDFGGGSLSAPGPSNATFLARLAPTGAHSWSRTLGDSLELGTNKLAVDASGNALLALEFRGTVDFGGGPVTAAGFRDGIIAKYDAAGNHLWSRNFGGTSAFVQVKAAGVDGFGNLVVAGTFTGDIDFGGEVLSYTPFTTNMFVVKFDADGNHVWSEKFTGGLVEITAVTGDVYGNTIVTGYHGSTFDFGGGPLDADIYDIFIAKYGPAGTHSWSYSFGEPGTYQHAFDVATDAAGGVIITGHFKTTLDLGGGPMISAGGWDMFVGKFDRFGAHSWSQRFGDANTQRSYSVAVGGASQVTIAGHSFGSVDFGGGALVGDPIDLCVARFDQHGAHLWSRRLDVENLGLQNDKPYAIAAASNATGDMAFAGSFKDAIHCGGDNLASSGGWDTFVAEYSATATAVGNPAAGPSDLFVYPNPFNPRTTISFDVRTPGRVRLTIHDVTGRRVRTLTDGWSAAGSQTASWDGRDGSGRVLASGVYFARLESDNAVRTRRLVLLK